VCPPPLLALSFGKSKRFGLKSSSVVVVVEIFSLALDYRTSTNYSY
jgi:hypothetical protein